MRVHKRSGKTKEEGNGIGSRGRRVWQLEYDVGEKEGATTNVVGSTVDGFKLRKNERRGRCGSL